MYFDGSRIKMPSYSWMQYTYYDKINMKKKNNSECSKIKGKACTGKKISP